MMLTFPDCVPHDSPSYTLRWLVPSVPPSLLPNPSPEHALKPSTLHGGQERQECSEVKAWFQFPSFKS